MRCCKVGVRIYLASKRGWGATGPGLNSNRNTSCDERKFVQRNNDRLDQIHFLLIRVYASYNQHYSLRDKIKFFYLYS